MGIPAMAADAAIKQVLFKLNHKWKLMNSKVSLLKDVLLHQYQMPQR